MLWRRRATSVADRSARTSTLGRNIRAIVLLVLLALLLPTWSDGATSPRPGMLLSRVNVSAGLVRWAFPTADGATLVAGTSPYGTFYLASLTETGSVVWSDDYDVEGYDTAQVLDAAALPDGTASVLIEHSSAKTPKEGRTVVAYGPGGERAWSHAFDESKIPVALVLDRSGNTIVAGEQRQTGRQPDAYVAKFTPEGDLVWERRYNGPRGAYSDVAQDLAADAAGNVYVCGNTYGGKTRDSDVLLLKYSKDGRLTWSRTYHRPRSRTATNKCDTAFNVTLDRRGDVILGGWSHISKPDWDFLVVKYTSAGRLRWAKSYTGPKANGRDLATLLATDKWGNVSLAGESQGPRARDWAVVSFSASGARRWSYRFDGPERLEDVPTAMCVGPTGIVYVTGETWRVRRQSEYTILAIARNGARRWIQRWNPGGYRDTPHATWFDRKGRLYVAGLVTEGERPWDYQGAIIRLAP